MHPRAQLSRSFASFGHMLRLRKEARQDPIACIVSSCGINRIRELFEHAAFEHKVIFGRTAHMDIVALTRTLLCLFLKRTTFCQQRIITHPNKRKQKQDLIA